MGIPSPRPSIARRLAVIRAPIALTRHSSLATPRLTAERGGPILTGIAYRERYQSASIDDVARRAGVSIATVSRYLKGDRVRAAEAVRQAIDDLQYQPTHAARALRSGIHYAIAVVVPDITNPFFAALVKGIESVFRPGPYSVLLSGTDESSEIEDEVLEDVVGRVDGVILVPATEREPLSIQPSRIAVPTVLVDRDVPGEFDRVMVDNVGGAALAADHLVELGHREIAIVSGPLDTLPGRERHDGFLEALERAGVEMCPEHDVAADFRESGGYNAMLQLLALPEVPTAVFCANNMMTLGALNALQAMRVPVPEQISVVGFDDLATAPLLDPPLTVIDRPMVDQGVLAARLLFSRLDKNAAGDCQRVVLPTRLVKRQSCAPPRPSGTLEVSGLRPAREETEIQVGPGGEAGRGSSTRTPIANSTRTRRRSS